MSEPKQAPDRGWLDFLKVTFGFLLVLTIASLAALIALGKVEQQTSFGLDIILGGLLTLTGGFANWAFNGTKNDKE